MKNLKRKLLSYIHSLCIRFIKYYDKSYNVPKEYYKVDKNLIVKVQNKLRITELEVDNFDKHPEGYIDYAKQRCLDTVKDHIGVTVLVGEGTKEKVIHTYINVLKVI